MLLSLSASAQYSDTVYVGRRDPVLYYWGNNWIDRYCPTANYEHRIFFNTLMYEGAPAYLRPCYADSTLKVVGVAAVAEWYHQENTDDLVPEYLELWDVNSSGLDSLAAVRIDTMVPSRCFQLVIYRTLDCYTPPTFECCYYYHPLYEAYFDKPYTVSGMFGVGGTMNNAVYHRDSLGFLETRALMCYYYQYAINIIYDNYVPTYPGYIWKKYTINTLGGVGTIPDSMVNAWFRDSIEGEYIMPCFFPIIDTTGMCIGCPRDTAAADTCPGVTGFRLLEHTASTATFSWSAANGYSQWELGYKRQHAPYDSLAVRRVNGTYYTLSLLDSGTAYRAYIRGVCDTVGNRVNPWSDSISFVASDGTGAGIGGEVDRYTYLYPSPARDALFVGSSFHLRSVEIFSVDGRLLQREYSDELSMLLDVSSLPSGTYIVRISTPVGVCHKKFVKE